MYGTRDSCYRCLATKPEDAEAVYQSRPGDRGTVGGLDEPPDTAEAAERLLRYYEERTAVAFDLMTVGMGPSLASLPALKVKGCTLFDRSGTFSILQDEKMQDNVIPAPSNRAL